MRGSFVAIWPVADLLGEEEWREEEKKECQGKCTWYRDVSRHSEGEKSARHVGELMSNDAAVDEKMKMQKERCHRRHKEVREPKPARAVNSSTHTPSTAVSRSRRRRKLQKLALHRISAHYANIFVQLECKKAAFRSTHGSCPCDC